MPKGTGYRSGSDKGFFGHYDVPTSRIVKNPAQATNALGKDKHTAKSFLGMIKGPVGKGAPINTGDRR